MSYPKVYIIVLNWNGVLDTLALIKTLMKMDYPYFEIVVVDNGSTDDSVKKISQNFPEVKIIEAGKNLGFALGNNVGIKYALNKFAEYILILNNDTLVDRHLLSNLMRAATQEKDYSVFGPQIRLYPKKDRLWYAGGKIFMPLASVKMFCRNKNLTCTKIKENIEVDFVTGTAMLIRASAFKKIGGFDKRFFVYWEETDWEAKALKRREKFMYVPEAVLYHKVARASGGEGNPKMQYYFTRNNLLFARKNLPGIFWLTFLPYFILRVFVYEFLRGLVDFLILKPNRMIGWFYILRGIFDFIRGKFGKVV
jgi:hypothetical protein